MLSPADTVIVFVLALIVIFVVLFSVMSARSARSRSSAQSNPTASTPKGSEIPVEQPAVANRLDPSGSGSKGSDPRGVDVGGNYN